MDDRDGDREAFRTLVDRHSRYLSSLAHRMTGNAQDAEDVVQEAWLKAHKQLTRTTRPINRLIRQSGAQSGDAAVADVLEDLERVPQEIANAPADVTSNEWSDLKSRITAQDLLFRVRVIASAMCQRTPTDREAGVASPKMEKRTMRAVINTCRMAMACSPRRQSPRRRSNA